MEKHCRLLMQKTGAESFKLMPALRLFALGVGHVIMGVAHGTEKETVLAHKRAIDEHLKEVRIPVSYTNVFWGGRSEIKPSEISPFAYSDWCTSLGIDPAIMRE